MKETGGREDKRSEGVNDGSAAATSRTEIAGEAEIVGQIVDKDSELLRCTPEAKEPIPQLNRLRSPRPSSA